MAGLAVMAALVAGCSPGLRDDNSPWEQRASMEVARSEIPAVGIGDLVYVPGGLVSAPQGVGVTASVERYSIRDDRWASVADLPEPRHHAMAAAIDGRLYVLGGFDASGFNPVDGAWVFDPAVGTWSEIADLPETVGAGAAVTIGDSIYVVGGVPGGRSLLVYDPAFDIWERLAPMDQAREHLAAVAFRGELWVIGGRWDGQMLRAVEVFDPDTGGWANGPDLRAARSGFGAAVLGESIIVAGGEVFGPNRALDSVEQLSGRAWEEAEPLPRTLHGVALVAVDDELLVFGGSTRAGDVANTGEVWRLQP